MFRERMLNFQNLSTVTHSEYINISQVSCTIALENCINHNNSFIIMIFLLQCVFIRKLAKAIEMCANLMVPGEP